MKEKDWWKRKERERDRRGGRKGGRGDEGRGRAVEEKERKRKMTR